MALFDTRSPELLCSDPERCERGYSPASTFKIANTIIALETGVVSDAESILPWDGITTRPYGAPFKFRACLAFNASRAPSGALACKIG